MAGRTIVPRYIGFYPTGTAASSVTGATPNANGPLFPAMEVEGFERTIAAVESQIEDGQTTIDAMDVTVSGYIRGTGLLGAANVNSDAPSGARVNCNFFMIGAPGTLGFVVKNIQMNAVYNTEGIKERVMFKGTKRFVRSINATGADIEIFTS